MSAVQLATDIEWKYQSTLPLLLEKIINRSYEDVVNFVKTSLNDNQNFVPLGLTIYSSDHLPQPIAKKKRYNNFQCFETSDKHGCFKKCSQTCISKNCCSQNSSAALADRGTLQLNLIFQWNMEKCIDATPCLLYLPQ